MDERGRKIQKETSIWRDWPRAYRILCPGVEATRESSIGRHEYVRSIDHFRLESYDSGMDTILLGIFRAFGALF